jgi:hypothetical protein
MTTGLIRSPAPLELRTGSLVIIENDANASTLLSCFEIDDQKL